MSYKVSVIIPVYGAEKYIERCARSLFGQTLREVEYIFVDDCTTDRSMDVLRRVMADYPQRQPDIRLLRTPKNSGQALARRIGMKAAKGEYMIHCDPDDWVDACYYESLYIRASEAQADICQGAIIYHNVDSSFRRPCQHYSGPGMKAMLEGKYYWSLCMQLVRLSLVERYCIYPFEGINSGEDVNVVMRAYAVADKVTRR